MLTAKERRVRFVSRFLVCLRGLVVKAEGTLGQRLFGAGSNPKAVSFLHPGLEQHRRDSNPQPQSWKG